jgi:hypothetical protein
VLYHGISLVSVFGLRGTLYVQKAGTAEGVSVQIEGSYEAKVADGSWLRIYPEGQEPPIPVRSHTDITHGRTHVGSVDVTARARFLTGSGPRVRARASARVKATVRVTAPPGTRFELLRCYGRRKGPRSSWHLMRGNRRFVIPRR